MSFLVYAFLIAAGVVLISGPILLPLLHRLKFGQSIREEGPKSHQAKSGTPTMGGLMIVLAIFLATVLTNRLTLELSLALFIMLGHFLIGFIDDYIKVVLKRNLGLKARQKLLGQILMAAVVTYIGVNYLGMSTMLWLPLTGTMADLGLLYYVLVFVVLVGTTNAVNLTDGLDGLAAGTVAVAAGAYLLICLHFGHAELASFCAAGAGACLAFLRFNAHPAKVFMGDTGSLALGGMLAAVAVLTKTEILLILVGGIFVIEASSVILQVVSFKTRGKRIFLMSPIHHHFELKGWSERKVVTVFWSVGIIFSIIALAIVKLS